MILAVLFLLLSLLGILNFGICFYFFVLIDELLDYLDRPRSVCEDINWWTPILVGSQVISTLICICTGSYYLTLYNVPMLILHFHQYSRRVPDSNYGYHNPIRFFSHKHLEGLKSIYIIMLLYYLLSAGIYGLVFILTLLL